MGGGVRGGLRGASMWHKRAETVKVGATCGGDSVITSIKLINGKANV